MNPINDPRWVSKTPIATVFLLEAANVGQIVRMWTERSALGQSVWSWVSVNCALWMWMNWYRVITPKEAWARRGAAVGIGLNSAVIASVVWFRFVEVRP